MALKIKTREPQTEVVLPYSGKKVLMKPLTVGIQKQIATSEINTFSQRMKFICKVLWDRVANKDEFNNNYIEFTQSIYLDDIEMMTYGMLCSTYKKPIDLSLVCPKCSTIMQRNVLIKDSILDLNINVEGKDVKDEFKRQIDFEEYGISIKVRPFNVAEFIAGLEIYESLSINNLAESVNINKTSEIIYMMSEVTAALCVESITDEEGKIEEFNVLLNRNKFIDLIKFIEGMPEEVSEKIVDVISDIPYFVKFGIKTNCTNPKCDAFKTPIEIEISYSQLFFPKVSI